MRVSVACAVLFGSLAAYAQEVKKPADGAPTPAVSVIGLGWVEDEAIKYVRSWLAR